MTQTEPDAPVLMADCVAITRGTQRVLTSASLRAVRGRTTALFGRNGAGKSTLLRIAAGLLQPDGGVVRVDGEAVFRANAAALARRGVLFLPDRDLLSTRSSVRAQLGMFRAQFGNGDVLAAATRVGIAPLLDRNPDKLSGGERRRADVAAILVRQPRCLLADEPFRGLAPLDVEALGLIFRELASTGCAVVITGHEVNAILDTVDHVTWCTAGTTYELGAPAQALQHREFAMQYAGTSGAAAVNGLR